MMVLTVAILSVAISGAALATSTAIVNGTSAGDHIKGTAKADTIHGKGGNDAIHGMGGNDLLFGDDGHDGLYGGPGNDTVIAIGDAPGDFVDCGAGTDTVQRSFRSEHDVFVNCERFTS